MRFLNDYNEILSIEGLLLILPVDQFLDMGRSGTNVVGNAVATVVVGRVVVGKAVAREAVEKVVAERERA